MWATEGASRREEGKLLSLLPTHPLPSWVLGSALVSATATVRQGNYCLIPGQVVKRQR